MSRTGDSLNNVPWGKGL